MLNSVRIVNPPDPSLGTSMLAKKLTRSITERVFFLGYNEMCSCKGPFLTQIFKCLKSDFIFEYIGSNLFFRHNLWVVHEVFAL